MLSYPDTIASISSATICRLQPSTGMSSRSPRLDLNTCVADLTVRMLLQETVWKLLLPHETYIHLSFSRMGVVGFEPTSAGTSNSGSSSLQYFIILPSVKGTIHPLPGGIRCLTSLEPARIPDYPKPPGNEIELRCLSFPHLLGSLSSPHPLLSPFPAHLAALLPYA